MATEFKLEIYTQEKRILETSVLSLTAPGQDGYLGVLAHHAPLVTTLGEGVLTLRDKNGERTMPMTGGFLEVADNVATLLVDQIEIEPED
jgi:F-type H+-transporting ATPase subunit epsilon